MPFGQLFIAGQARIALEDLRPSRARSGVARTLRRSVRATCSTRRPDTTLAAAEPS
jgi:hypothetical protein